MACVVTLGELKRSIRNMNANQTRIPLPLGRYQEKQFMFASGFLLYSFTSDQRMAHLLTDTLFLIGYNTIRRLYFLNYNHN